MVLTYPFRRLVHLAGAGLHAAVALVHLLRLGHRHRFFLHQFRILQQRALVALEGKYVVRPAVDYLLRYGGLRAHRVNGYYGAFDAQHVQQLGDCRYLVALVARLALPQADAVLHAPRVDEVDGRVVVVAVAAPADRLAVNGNDLLVRTLRPQPLRPLQEQTLELPEPYGLENAVYGVVRRYPVRKPQPFLQRLVVVPAEFLYRFVTLGPAGDGQYRQYHYVGEKVLAPSLHPGVVQPCCCLV